ncbi:MAG: hypothetical protein ABF876_12685 [Acetobacter aceti]|uniref:hypothetical protein n=1 Tax=Acetobacter aceti TaxID=435 RepID=UPI0011EA594F|nr:hypothetical protein [Acetobacter aceti]
MVIAYKINDSVLTDAFEISIGIITTISIMIWFVSAKRYAKDNPELALMEGAQLVIARQFQFQTANPNRSINSGEERSDGHTLPSSISNKEDKDA